MFSCYLFYKPTHELELYDASYCFGHKEEYEQRQRRNEILDFADKIMDETNNLFMELEVTNNKTFYMIIGLYINIWMDFFVMIQMYEILNILRINIVVI